MRKSGSANAPDRGHAEEETVTRRGQRVAGRHARTAMLAPIIVTPPAVVTTPSPAVVTTPPPAVVVAPTPVRPGFGRVESMAATPSSAAAAGGTTMRRLSIKMEDGTMQFVDTAAGNVTLGDRVELTSEGRIRH